MQMFPLAADPVRLQQFCDELFNDYVPASVAHFRPALPLVICTVLHYPEMGGELPWRTGTLSQNEIYFMVLLEHHRRVRGRWQFLEYAAATPYILVDSAESAVAGRERFGMPKQDATFTGQAPELPWPPDPEPYLTVSAYNPSPAGHRLDPLLQVLRHPPRSPDLGFSEARAAGPGRVASVMQPGALLWLLRALSRSMAMGRPPDAWLRSVAGLARIAAGGTTLPVCSLRQFGDPEYQDAARYQDLVVFRAKVSDVQRLGVLRVPTEIRLHRTEVRPIAQRLGLRIARREAIATPDGEGTVDVLETLGAVYAQMDLDLQESERLCWRGADTPWCLPDGSEIGPAPRRLRARYNRSLGPSAAAYLEERGPRPILDFKFLMLPADRDCVVDLVSRGLPAEASLRVEPISVGNVCAVRIAAYRSRPRAPSDQEELQWLDGNYVSVSIPVHLELGGTSGTGLFLLRDFTDNGFMVQALRELALAPSSSAEFSSDGGGWFSTTRPTSRVLTMTAPALQRTAVGARVVPQPVLDVFAVAGSSTEADLPIGIGGAELDDVVRQLWPHVFGIFPIVSYGSIPSPAGRGRPVSRRVVLTLFDDYEVTDEGQRPHTSVSHLLRLHDSETFPLWRKLAFHCLPDSSRLGGELRRGIVGRSWAVPAIGYGEASYRIKLSRLRVLWEQHQRGKHER